MSKTEFFNEFLAFFNEESTEKECTGKLKIFSTYLAARVNDPVDILHKLELLGVNCDCKLVDNFFVLLKSDNPLGFNSVEIGDNGLFDITWDLSAFELFLEACQRQAVGIKINDEGYFPPNSIMQIAVRADGLRVLLDSKGFVDNVDVGE